MSELPQAGNFRKPTTQSQSSEFLSAVHGNWVTLYVRLHLLFS